ncbi:uncharacterized protein BDZ99DRAFT_563713 [Mytilinidion resinicola]|uniref:Uncharacterized protein n=1 Tax=Mytilinidion resinicola TaxID=574789 RepID=A0A6A6YNP7_9PEZI|nr:uncharacterized protein BDZ99DRAFT_563713 [Mytilinidion resinicola]KAF2810516.1 hypothetical protein BDZ99DRAFT_563713 [Mytilinidion resinicola]
MADVAMSLTLLVSDVSSRFRPNTMGRSPSSFSTISKMNQASTSVDSLVLLESNQEDVSVTRLRKEIIYDFENPKLLSESSSRNSRDLSGCVERRFVDKIGMVIPGVSDREPCNIQRAHYVTMWSLGSPIEYSTSEADHGITFDDHRKLHLSLESFLYRTPKETRDTTEKAFFKIISALNSLLSDITTWWRARGIPATLCLTSVGMFAPDRLKESYIQILHTPLHRDFDFDGLEKHHLAQEDGLPFYAPYWAIPQHSTLSLPWPLRPLPPHKEDLALRFPERYGADPYYRSAIKQTFLARRTP